MTEKFKTDEKQTEAKKEDKKRFVKLLDSDQTEIKKLEEDDIEAVMKIMKKCEFEVTEKEVRDLISQGLSFGAYVNRMLVGVGLAWPASFDENELKIVTGTTNAIYNEDPAILLSYEGRGIRRILLLKREEEAVAKGFIYSIAYLYEDVPKGEVSSYVRETGSQLEKLYLSENYKFHKTKKGVLAMKKLI